MYSSSLTFDILNNEKQAQYPVQSTLYRVPCTEAPCPSLTVEDIKNQRRAVLIDSYYIWCTMVDSTHKRLP